MIFRKKEVDPSPDICPNEKINYNEVDLLDELHRRFFESFAVTLDVADYVPQKYIDKVCSRIFKVLKKHYRIIGRTDKAYQKWFRENLPQLLSERKQAQQEAVQQQSEGDDIDRG